MSHLPSGCFRQISTNLAVSWIGSGAPSTIKVMETVPRTKADLPPRVVPQVKLVWPQPSGLVLAPEVQAV